MQTTIYDELQGLKRSVDVIGKELAKTKPSGLTKGWLGDWIDQVQKCVNQMCEQVEPKEILSAESLEIAVSSGAYEGRQEFMELAWEIERAKRSY